MYHIKSLLVTWKKSGKNCGLYLVAWVSIQLLLAPGLGLLTCSFSVLCHAAQRQFAETDMNLNSSRSHTIFRMVNNLYFYIRALEYVCSHVYAVHHVSASKVSVSWFSFTLTILEFLYNMILLTHSLRNVILSTSCDAVGDWEQGQEFWLQTR